MILRYKVVVLIELSIHVIIIMYLYTRLSDYKQHK